MIQNIFISMSYMIPWEIFFFLLRKICLSSHMFMCFIDIAIIKLTLPAKLSIAKLQQRSEQEDEELVKQQV